jgi:cytochrome c-type protein NapC
MTPLSQPLALAAVIAALLAATMLVGFLLRRPRLDWLTKLLLFVAMGILPIAAAIAGNVSGLETMKDRRFCGSCHNMVPYARDAADLLSSSMAAVHSRNQHFGEQSCFTCHRDYGMYGGVVTKLDGLKHVWAYYYERPDKRPLALYHPMQNDRCTRCHSTQLRTWRKVMEHQAVLENIQQNGVSCMGRACHGPAHGTVRAALPSASDTPPPKEDRP